MLALFDLHPFFYEKDPFINILSQCSSSPSTKVVCIESGLTSPRFADQNVLSNHSFSPAYLCWSHLRKLNQLPFSEVVRVALPNASLQDYIELEQIFLQGYSWSFSSVEFELITRNLSRWDYAKMSIGFLHEYIDRVSRFWNAYFQFFSIKVVFGHICHSGEDLIAMFSCKHISVPFLSFNIGCTDGIYILNTSNLEHISLRPFRSILDFSISPSHYEYIRSKAGILDYGISKGYSKPRAVFNLNHSKLSKDLLLKDLISKPDNRASLYVMDLISAYRSLSCDLSSIDLNKYSSVYIYFLQSQPEATTVPSALAHHDQLRTIRFIRSTIDSNALLLIKEHPAQFRMYQEIPHFNGIDHQIYLDNRSPSFYPEIASLPGTFLLDLHTPASSLLKLKPSLYTSVGTAGIEFYLAGCPVYQLESFSPYYTFLQEYGLQEQTKEQRINNLGMFMSNHTFEISQFTGKYCDYYHRELFSYEYFEEATHDERKLVATKLGQLIGSISTLFSNA